MNAAPRATVPWAALAVAAAAIGLSYPVSKAAFETIPPVAFVAWRFTFAAVSLLVLAFPTGARLWRDGAIAGGWLSLGYVLQAVGLDQTSATNTALISGLHVVMAPLLVAALRRTRPSPWVIVAVVLGFVGVTLLTLDETFGPGAGDLVVLGAALAFGANVAVLASAATRHPLIPLTAVQLLVTAVTTMALSSWVDGPTLPTGQALPAVIATGVGLTAGAHLAQVWAQTRLGPERAALGLSLIPVMGASASVLLLAERIPAHAWLGAAVIVAAVAVVMARNHDLDAVTAESVGAGH